MKIHRFFCTIILQNGIPSSGKNGIIADSEKSGEKSKNRDSHHFYILGNSLINQVLIFYYNKITII